MSEVKLTKAAYKKMMNENIEWLKSVRNINGGHLYCGQIIEVLNKSVEHFELFC